MVPWWNTKQHFHAPAVAEWVPSAHLHFSFSFWAKVRVVASYQQFWNRQFSNRLKGGISWSPFSSRWLFVRLFLLIAKDYWQKSSWTALVWSMTVSLVYDRSTQTALHARVGWRNALLIWWDYSDGAAWFWWSWPEVPTLLTIKTCIMYWEDKRASVWRQEGGNLTQKKRY